MLTFLGADPGKRAHHAAYLAHYVADPVSAKHADIMTLDDATLEKLAEVSKKWLAASNDEIENWIADPIITEAVTLIENRARAISAQGGAWLDRVNDHIGLIGGTKLLQRGWWYASWVDIADSSLRSAIACYLHELGSLPTASGVTKPLPPFYSYFDPFYFNGPIYNPAGYAPSFKICEPLSEHPSSGRPTRPSMSSCRRRCPPPGRRRPSLASVWRIDALRCPHCGGRMRIIGAVRNPDAISAILAAIHADRWTDTARGPPETMTRHDQAA